MNHPDLAINSGAPAVTVPFPKMYPGGMRVGDEELAALTELVRTQRLFRYYGPVEGPSAVEAFERAAAHRLGAAHVQAVSSACGALICGLAALGVGPGDEVIVPAFTWVATASAVVGVGAVPIIAECDDTLNLDPDSIASLITERTKAIAVVHMRGGPADMGRLLPLARSHGIPILEDTAQAFGGTYQGQSLGTLGAIGVYSLQYNKIITSGEGGLVVTADRTLWERVAMVHDVVGALRNKIPDALAIPGLNFRMSELQGAVALAQLAKLDGILADMRRIRAAIRAGIEGFVTEVGGIFRREPDPAGDAGICLAFFLPTVEQARFAAKALRAEGLPTMNLCSDQVDYHLANDWVPILAQRGWSAATPWTQHPSPPAYTRDSWPQTTDWCMRSVHLDISPNITEAQIDMAIEAYRKVLSALPR